MSCENFDERLDLSLAGVQECKSSSLSADVYSVSFKKCNTVYPIRIIRPFNKFKVNEQNQIKIVLEDINQNECILKNAVGDNPKRSGFRCALGHGSSFACEYCESKAVYITVTDRTGKKRVIWPGHPLQPMAHQEQKKKY